MSDFEQLQKGEFMSRRELRVQIFKMLFRVEFHSPDDIKEQMQLFFDGEVNEETAGMSEEDQEYIVHKVEQIREKLPVIDEAINENTQGWKTSRMGKVDLTLIRLATYEIKFDEAVPTGVAINEAVEIAKKYGTVESPAFVNGVLAKLA